ncbi:MAG: M12 family metallopeptidase [Acidobacteriota bacterium]
MQISMSSLLSAVLVLILLTPAVGAQAPTQQSRHAHGHPWKGDEEAFPGQSGTPKSAILVNADGSQGEVINYIDYDGVAIYGGDIVLNVEDGYAAFTKSRLEGAFNTKSAGRTADSSLWPGGLVPYTVDSGVSSTAQDWISEAMAHWESRTTIRFVPRTDEDDYLRFHDNSSRCASYVGRQGGSQRIWVNGCWEMGNAIHEIGHAMGLYHEHTRADRDEHVVILWKNVDPDSVDNFHRYTDADGADLGDYDFGSIMHYSCWAGGGGRQTIYPRSKPNTNCNAAGQRNGFSDGDIEGIAELYPELTMMATNYGGTTGQGKVLYQIDATDGSTSQSSAILGGTSCLSDMDFHPHLAVLYGVNCSDTANTAGSTIVRIDNLTFGFALPHTPLGNGREATSIAVSPSGNELYAIDQQGTGWGTSLFKVNLLNGRVSDIGTLAGSRTQATSIAFHDDGTLYAIDNTYNNGAGAVLFTVDTGNAQTSTVGWMRGDRTHATSIRFGSGGTLYGINNSGNGMGNVLFLIDTEDASTRDVAVLSGEQRWATALAIHH